MKRRPTRSGDLNRDPEWGRLVIPNFLSTHPPADDWISNRGKEDAVLDTEIETRLRRESGRPLRVCGV